MEETKSDEKQLTFIDYTNAIQDKLLECDRILDELIGREAPSSEAKDTEPGCEFDILDSLLKTDYRMTGRLYERLKRLQNKI